MANKPKVHEVKALKIRGHDAEVAEWSAVKLKELRLHKGCSLFPPLDDDAMESLRVSIGKGYDEGQPIVVWKRPVGEMVIVDGKHRRDILVELGWEGPVAFVPFKDEREVQDFIVGANLARRHLTAKDRRELREKLYKLGAKIPEIAKQLGETESNVSKSLATVRTDEKNKRNEAIAKEVAKGTPEKEIAKKTGASVATVRREKASPSPKKTAPVKPLPATSKPMPAGPALVKFNADCVNQFKFPNHGNAFRNAVTGANPVPFDEQLPLAARVFAAMTVEQRGDKVKGERIIAELVRKERGEKVTAPAATPPASNGGSNGGSNVVPLRPVDPKGGYTPVPTLAQAAVKAGQLVKLDPSKKLLEPKTFEQLLNLAFDVRDEVGGGLFQLTMEAMTHLVEASFSEKKMQTREDRLKELVGLVIKITAPEPKPEPAKADVKPAAPEKADAAPKPAENGKALAKVAAKAKGKKK